MRRITIVATTAAAVMAVTASSAAAQAPSGQTAGRSHVDAQQTMVTYEKSGGFAGIDDRITVDGNGKAHVVSGTVADIQLTSAETRALRQGLDGIWTWWPSTAGCDIADHFTYSLAYRGRQTMRCHDVPRDWRSAVIQLDAVIDRTKHSA